MAPPRVVAKAKNLANNSNLLGASIEGTDQLKYADMIQLVR